jgi:hypothetical protein
MKNCDFLFRKGYVRCPYSPCRENVNSKIYILCGKPTRVHRLRYHRDSFKHFCIYCGLLFDSNYSLGIHQSRRCAQKNKKGSDFWKYFKEMYRTHPAIEYNTDFISTMTSYAADENTREENRKLYLISKTEYFSSQSFVKVRLES